MGYVLAFILMVILTGCSSHADSDCRATVDITFNNAANLKTKLVISNGTDSITLDAAANTSQTNRLCFDKAPKTDGHYTLHFKHGVTDTITAKGYYTNGYPLEREIVVTYFKDSIAFETIDDY